MRLFATSLSAWVIIAAAGCGTSSERGGGTESHNSFTLQGPAMAMSIKQGQMETVNLTVNRGREFKQNVRLTAEAPPGVAADLSNTAIAPNDKGEISVKINIARTTPVGEHTIRIVGQPETGNTTSLNLKIRVQEGN